MMQDEKEQGATAIVVAVSMAALLAVLALVINTGLIYAEQAQLQNGADSAALSIAQLCSEDESDPLCSSNSPTAYEYASDNAGDGVTDVLPFTPDKTANTILIETTSKDVGIVDKGLQLFLADLFGISYANGKAQATASWGYPRKATIAFPLGIAECKFNMLPAAEAGATQTLSLDSGSCAAGIPGGFGWITKPGETNSSCSIEVQVGPADGSGEWFTSDPGASAPNGCGIDNVGRLRDQTVLFPLYDKVTGTGSSGQYYVKGFASFHVTAYRFSNLEWSKDGVKACNKCIAGQFVEFVSLSDAIEYGDAPDYGSSVIQLTR